MRFTTGLLLSAFSAIPKLVSAALIDNADTPVFYLLGDDSFGDRFLPLRLTGQHLVATLGGDGPIALLYYVNNTLVAEDPIGGSTSPFLYHPYIDFSLHTPSFLSSLYPVNTTKPNFGECGPSGVLKFVQDEDGIMGTGQARVEAANPCARFDKFSLFSDRMDAQLGAKLIFNSNLTDFYACGISRDIVYKADISNMPGDCPTVLELFTLPVV